MTEEIEPKLETLRAEKRSFLSYQKAVSELERMARLLRAHDWTEANSRVKKREAAVTEKKASVETIRGEKKSREEESKEAEKEKLRIEKKRDKELQKGGVLKALEEEVKNVEKELARLSTQAEIQQGVIDEDEKKVKAVEENSVKVSTSSKPP